MQFYAKNGFMPNLQEHVPFQPQHHYGRGHFNPYYHGYYPSDQRGYWQQQLPHLVKKRDRSADTKQDIDMLPEPMVDLRDEDEEQWDAPPSEELRRPVTTYGGLPYRYRKKVGSPTRKAKVQSEPWSQRFTDPVAMKRKQEAADRVQARMEYAAQIRPNIVSRRIQSGKSTLIPTRLVDHSKGFK